MIILYKYGVAIGIGIQVNLINLNIVGTLPISVFKRKKTQQIVTMANIFSHDSN